MNIIKGKIWVSPRIVVYGPEGIGKTTLASKLPKPLFIDFENGSARMDVDRLPVPATWSELNVLIDNLMTDHENYRCLVFDSADQLELLCIDHVCRAHNWKSIEDAGYGRGYTELFETWSKFLDKLNLFMKKTEMGVCFVAHAIQRKIEQPDQLGSYDHYELKLAKKLSPALKEWCDFLFFLNFKTETTNVGGHGSDAKLKALSQYREIHTQHTAWYDAKSRESCLPSTVRLNDDSISMIADALWQEVASQDEPPANADGKIAPNQGSPDQPRDDEWYDDKPSSPMSDDGELSPKQEELMKLLESSNLCYEDLDLCVAKMKILPKETPINAYNNQVCDRLITNWDKVVININKIKKG